MSAEVFEILYAQRSGVTVAWLHAHGRYAEPCDCGEDGCEGWAMGYQWEDAIVEDSLRPALPPEDPGGEGGEDGDAQDVEQHGRTP
jgi:hypothetical protein